MAYQLGALLKVGKDICKNGSAKYRAKGIPAGVCDSLMCMADAWGRGQSFSTVDWFHTQAFNDFQIVHPGECFSQALGLPQYA